MQSGPILFVLTVYL